ncbi:MAG: hypothetical protein ACJ8AI_00260 [Rhodopila sp.]
MSTECVGIIGIGQPEFRSRRDDAGYPDLVREGVARALKDAKLDFDAIQAVVYSFSRRHAGHRQRRAAQR